MRSMRLSFIQHLLCLIGIAILAPAVHGATVVTLSANIASASLATLNGSANPLGASTSGFFQYGTTTNYGNATTSQSLGGSFSSVPSFSQLITGLTGGVTYHSRAVVTSLGLTAFGSDQSFSLSPPLTVATTAATSRCIRARRLSTRASIPIICRWPFGLSTGQTTNYGSFNMTNSLGRRSHLRPGQQSRHRVATRFALAIFERLLLQRR